MLLKTAFRWLLPALLAVPLHLPAQAQLPPLIDRELFFGDPEISGGQLSPDGKYLSFIKPYNGTRNIWVKGLREPFASARPMTNDQARPVRGYFWSRDGKYLLYSQDKGGDENFNIYAVDPAAPLAAGRPATSPASRGCGCTSTTCPVPTPIRSTSASTTATRPGTTCTS